MAGNNKTNSVLSASNDPLQGNDNLNIDQYLEQFPALP